MDFFSLPNNVTEFVLLGLTQNPHLHKIPFIALLFIFLFIVLANLFIVITISLSPTLSAPMYFFLIHLSFLDASLTSISTLKMAFDLLYQRRTISWGGCLSQLFMEHFLGGSETIVLTVMAYDHYVASESLCTTRPSCDRGSASSWWWWPGLGHPACHREDSFHSRFDLL